MSREAMKLALEALKNFEKAGLATLKTIDAITAIKQALEQPEPEPVAVVSGYYGGKCVVLPTDPARIFNSGTAFYTHPPKREPLTDEQVNLVREMRDVQGQHGNWNYDPYMQGLYNGLEFAMSLLEKREPVFRDAPEQWLGDITIKRDKFNSIEECKPTTGIKGEA